jgi:ribonuclease HII
MTKVPLSRPTLALEKAAGAPKVPVAGVDEVGRGPLAGPVVAAAVILPAGRGRQKLAGAVADSKVLTAATRQALARDIREAAMVGVGAACVGEIHRLNILHASLLAMRRALRALPVPAAHVLVDGNRLPDDLDCAGEAVVDGDAKCASIAAASIVAKVTRDLIMARLAPLYPGYGWERNAGYATREHCAALQTLGLTPHHRRTYAPVAAILAGSNVPPYPTDQQFPEQ